MGFCAAVRAAHTVTTAIAIEGGDQLFLAIVGDGVLQTSALPSTGRVGLGRAAENEIRIDDGSISRNHAILLVGEVLHIIDNSSANGTWVREQRIAPNTPVEILSERDRLKR